MHTHHTKNAARAKHRPAASPKPTHPAEIRPGEAPGPRTVTDADIRQAAYQRWERAGKPAGDGVQFWLEAEVELMRGA